MISFSLFRNLRNHIHVQGNAFHIDQGFPSTVQSCVGYIYIFMSFQLSEWNANDFLLVYQNKLLKEYLHVVKYTGSKLTCECELVCFSVLVVFLQSVWSITHNAIWETLQIPFARQSNNMLDEWITIHLFHKASQNHTGFAV